jgi:tetratricopeptide (TPR) repeat protein
MEQVGLSVCEEEAWRALEAGAPARALAIGAHILEHYPRAVSAHLLVGEALRRSGHIEGAQEFLLRSLSADPEASSAYAGLSQLAAANGDLEEAIWHAERAFELTPWDARGQQWLRRLRARRDSVERRRVPLTRAALARLHVSGGSFHRARLELESLLREDPQRLDLLATLIVVLWRLEEAQDLVVHCEQALELLPDCYKANLLLGFWQQQEGNLAQATEHLAQAQAVDPDGRQAAQLLGAETALAWEPTSVPPWDGANLPLWTKAVAQLQEGTPLFDPQEVAWMWKANEGCVSDTEDALPFPTEDD